MNRPGPAHKKPREHADWLVIVLLAVFGAGFVFCVIARSSGWRPALTGPGIYVAIFGIAGSVLLAYLRSDR